MNKFIRVYKELYFMILQKKNNNSTIQCELKKRKPRFNTNSLKTKKTNHNIVISG